MVAREGVHTTIVVATTRDLQHEPRSMHQEAMQLHNKFAREEVNDIVSEFDLAGSKKRRLHH